MIYKVGQVRPRCAGPFRFERFAGALPAGLAAAPGGAGALRPRPAVRPVRLRVPFDSQQPALQESDGWVGGQPLNCDMPSLLAEVAQPVVSGDKVDQRDGSPD